MAFRREATEDFVLGKRSLVSAPWVEMTNDAEPVLISASAKASRVADGYDRFTFEELQRVVALLARGSA